MKALLVLLFIAGVLAGEETNQFPNRPSLEIKNLQSQTISLLSQITQARVRHETDNDLPIPSPTPKKKQKASRAKKFQGGG